MITTFLPIPRTLMGPGPSDVHPRIVTAMAKPTIGHLDPEFIRLMDEIKVMLQGRVSNSERFNHSAISTG